MLKTVFAVDSHTMGEPTRIVIGGIPFIPGNSMAEKRNYLRNSMDDVRRALMLEPRGHGDMFGAILTPPVDPAAQLGVVYMNTEGYLNMCGHGTIGVITVALELGMISQINKPVTEIILDTPAGLVKTRARIVENKVKDVTFQNVPCFVYKHHHRVLLPKVGEINVDIVFGGNFFGIVSAKDLGVSLEKAQIPELISLGMQLKEILNQTLAVLHPQKDYIHSIDLIEIFDTTSNPDAELKNCVVFGNRQIDRSPCGTGTCAKLALLYANKKIKMNQSFRYESIIGTVFQGCIVGETKVGHYSAVIPEVTGSAYITGIQQFLINGSDPLKDGFSLR